MLLSDWLRHQGPHYRGEMQVHRRRMFEATRNAGHWAVPVGYKPHITYESTAQAETFG
jgi:hypothetical protein